MFAVDLEEEMVFRRSSAENTGQAHTMKANVIKDPGLDLSDKKCMCRMNEPAAG